MNIGDLVTDWGGFEKLVAALHETGDVTVEHNVQLVGQSGAPRQIDVLLKHYRGLYEHVVIVECKYWNSPVERLHIDALATTVREVGASKGVIFSAKGFQSGAITQAAHDNIDLFTVRELTDGEWGQPGKVVDIFLHINAVSIGNLRVVGASSLPGFGPRNHSLDIRLGDPATDSETCMCKDGESETILEKYLSRVAYESANKVYLAKPMIFKNGSREGKMLAKAKVNIAPKVPIKLNVDGGLVVVPRIEFDVGLVVSQSRITVDRSSNYLFALAVEDCVRERAVFATRKKAADAMTLLEPMLVPDGTCADDTLKNGSTLSVWLKGFESFDQFLPVSYGQWIEP